MKSSAATLPHIESPPRRRLVEQLYQAHEPYVRALLRQLLGKNLGDQAPDLAQEVFLIALRKLEAHSELQMRRYLTALAVRLAVNARRRRWLRQKLFLENYTSSRESWPSPEALALGREEIATLLELLERLPEKRRVAFLLVDLKGLSVGDAAAALGCDAPAVYKHRFHARKRLLQLYEEMERAEATRSK